MKKDKDEKILKSVPESLKDYVYVNEGEVFPKEKLPTDLEEEFEKFKKGRKTKKIASKVLEVVGIVLLALFAFYVIPFGIIIGMLMSGFNDKYDITTDLSKYHEVIVGNKWDLSEEIFPEDITDLNVEEFKHVYYNPWDANYLAYLVVNYDDEGYQKELERLNKIGIEDYKGFYSVTGFSNYELLAMEANHYNGFVYAMTDGNNKIIYVELIFCNYFMDIKYEKEIPLEYLPDGFDAKMGNPYEEEMVPDYKEDIIQTRR